MAMISVDTDVKRLRIVIHIDALVVNVLLHTFALVGLT